MILVTGATGTIGQEVRTSLAARRPHSYSFARITHLNSPQTSDEETIDQVVREPDYPDLTS
jgi:uncharacterized protein YbjT (DUF2867 family)